MRNKVKCPFVGRLLNGIHAIKCPNCGKHTWNGKPLKTLHEIANEHFVSSNPNTQTDRHKSIHVRAADKPDPVIYEFLAKLSSSGRTYGLLLRFGEYHLMVMDNRRWLVVKE